MKLIKKFVSILLTVIMILTVAPLGGFDFSVKSSALEATGSCGDDVYWAFDSSTGLLTISGTGAMEEYNNYYYSPLYNNSLIKIVVIESGVTSIGDNAFEGCTNLTSITISDSVTSIGENAFEGCTNLTSITIPDSVTSIGEWTFYDCTSLTSITIPDSVTSIGRYAFYDCTSLTSITIPGSVTSIGDDAFYNCTSLTSITIPDSVTSIGSSAFHDCTGLTSITIPDSVTSIGEWTFYDCTSLTSITIPDSVTSIGSSAFHDCTGLTSITIPNSVTSIGGYAFYDCTGLTSVIIGNSVTSIGDCVFIDCSNLSRIIVDSKNTVYDSRNNCNAIIETSTNTLLLGCKNTTIPDSVTSIGDDAFYNCTGLTNVTIGNSVTSIGRYAFYDCTGLTSVIIGNGVTSVGDWAFYKCTGLTSVTIGNSVTSIGDDTFYNCTDLTSIIVDSKNTVYDSRDNCNAIIKTSSNTLVLGCKNTTIPNSVTGIGSCAFSSCTGLTSITIGNSVASIGDWAFYKCTGLTSVTIGNSVTSIGDDAFYNCTSLTSITIGNGVTSICRNAFYNTAYYNNSNNWDNDVLYIGNYLIKAESSITGSYTIKSGAKLISDYAFYECTGLTSVTIGNGVTSIGDWAFGDCNGLISATIGNGVTSIGDDAFYGCTGLTSVTIPDSVTSIGRGGFYECSSLTSITIPNSVISIGSYAFKECTSLTSITIPNSVTSIGYSAFENCTSLTSVTIGNGVTSISEWTFQGCTGLTSVTIGNGVTSIGDDAFRYCTSLTSITIPDSVTKIGDGTFSSCTGLTSVTIGNSVKRIGGSAFSNTAYYNNSNNWDNNVLYIGNYLIDAKASLSGSYTIKSGTKAIAYGAFYYCNDLTSITISDSVTSIGENAFEGCTNLTSITIGNSVASIGEYAFSGTGYYNNSNNWDNNVLYIGNYLIDAKESLSGSYTIKSGTKVIADYAFFVCTSLTSITIPDNVTSIGSGIFAYCEGLTSITIPNSVTSIGDWAFGCCSSLTSITIPDSVTSIGDSAFKFCTSLTSITIPDSVTSIGGWAFGFCSSLTSITIPNSVTSIGDYAFYDCTSLKNVYYLGTEEQWNKITIDDGNAYLTNATIHYLGEEVTTYTVQYNANGGSVTPSSANVNSGESVTLPTPTRDGYTFLGWSTGSSATSPTYAVGSNLTVTGDTILYAVWKVNSYTIQFYDGSTLLGSKNVDVDENSTLNYGNVPTKMGYSFVGWSTINGGPALFSDGQNIKNLSMDNGSVVNFYAVWEKKANEVITDTNTGVTVTVPYGTYSGEVSIKVEKVLSGSVFDIIESQTDAIKTSVFSIDTYVNGSKTQPNGTVTVTIPVPSEFDVSKCKLYYINTTTNKVEEISFIVEDGNIVFTTNHFSNWAIVELAGKVNSVQINDVSLNYKKSTTITPTIEADAGVSYTVKYDTSNSKVATVDDNGKVYAKGTGNATITCTVTDSNGNEVSDTCTVKVSYAWWQWIIKIVLFGWIWY